MQRPDEWDEVARRFVTRATSRHVWEDEIATALRAAYEKGRAEGLQTATRPMGCVCPPMCEQTCQTVLCPRKSYGIRLAGGMP